MDGRRAQEIVDEERGYALQLYQELIDGGANRAAALQVVGRVAAGASIVSALAIVASEAASADELEVGRLSLTTLNFHAPWEHDASLRFFYTQDTGDHTFNQVATIGATSFSLYGIFMHASNNTTNDGYWEGTGHYHDGTDDFNTHSIATAGELLSGSAFQRDGSAIDFTDGSGLTYGPSMLFVYVDNSPEQ